MTKVHPAAGRPHGFWLDFTRLLRRAARDLGRHDPLRLGAATAFFTTFALPPILILFTAVLGALYPASVVRALLIAKLTNLIGDSGASLLDQIVLNVTNIQRTRLINTFGIIFLLFIATTLFVVIQHSLNDLWQVRPLPTRGRLQNVLRERGRSAAELIMTAVLAVTALMVDTFLHFVADYARDFDATATYYLFQILNFFTSLALLTVWFGLTFRTLSHALVPSPALWRGALLTGLLFELGQRVLVFLLRPHNLGPIYGPASSLVLLLLFVFYSAMMFYFGASFTKAYAHHIGQPLRPKPTAVRYRLVNLSAEELDNEQ